MPSFFKRYNLQNQKNRKKQEKVEESRVEKMKATPKKTQKVKEAAEDYSINSSDFDTVSTKSSYAGESSTSESGSEQGEFSDDEDVSSGSYDSSYSCNDNDDLSNGNCANCSNLTEEEGAESDDSFEVVAESDSSEDEVAPRNTIGNVPLEWYKADEHIGYDIAGKKIKKKERQNKLYYFLQSIDDSSSWRKIYDEYNDEEVELTKEETKLIHRLLEGKAPHADFGLYESYVDWFSSDSCKHPLSNAPEPKRRFTPSKWENKKVVEYRHAIEQGRIKFFNIQKDQRVDDAWPDYSSFTQRRGGLTYIPAPKSKLPGHEESYRPPQEYIPTQEEIDSYQQMFEEDRPQFIPKQFSFYRDIPTYDKLVVERFGRCMDISLCPRSLKKRINIDPESLKPKLPSHNDLKPYPTSCYLEFRGHKGPVTSVSTESTGQWIASGSTDGSVRVWEVETGRCLRVWDMGESVQQVAWNPLPELPLLAIAAGQDVIFLDTGLGSEEEENNIEDLLHVEAPTTPDDPGKSASIVSWNLDDKHGGIRLKHFKTVSSVEWHPRGDYLSTVMPFGESRSVLIHRLSNKSTRKLPVKLKGIVVSTAFHPTCPIFFVATKKAVRAYNLVQKKVKKLQPGVREVSSIAIHPSGDNVIVGSKDGKLCWFDMDISTLPYKVLGFHGKDINNVCFHRSYPLFSSCSDDCTAYVVHGKIFSDLNQNPLIIPLKILKGHASADGRGLLDCKFHPRQPWLFTAGADSVIKLYNH